MTLLLQAHRLPALTVLIALLSSSPAASGTQPVPAAMGGTAPGAVPAPFDAGVEYIRDLHVDASSSAGGDGSLGRPFRTIAEALAVARPGTRVRVAPGRYTAIGTVANLHGTAEAPIAIVGTDGPIIDTEGTGVALRLVDPRFVVIQGLVIERAVPHGMNIDDGGTYDSPARHVVLRDMIFRGIGNGGNNDCLKMSGVDDFHVEDSHFEQCNRGEAIDMVGCHRGVIARNIFAATPGTAVQTKGGSSDVLIHGNRFHDIAERAVSAGGSTGTPYFRPLDARHEAERIHVIANVMIRTGGTPIAFAGCFRCVFSNNTILEPGRHAARIIEENRSRAPGGDGYFINNIVVFRQFHGEPLVGTSPGAETRSFSFGSNLWYSEDGELGPAAALFSGLPIATDSVTGQDPLLDPVGKPSPGSPALRRGRPAPTGAMVDIQGRPFDQPPNIGAFAGGTP